jgi:hypothetical protein
MPFYGYKRPGAKVSEGVRNSFWLQGMMAGFPASLTSPQPTAGRLLPNAPMPKFSPCRPPSSPGQTPALAGIGVARSGKRQDERRGRSSSPAVRHTCNIRPVRVGHLIEDLP